VVGGTLEVFDRIVWNDSLDQNRLMPKKIRQKLKGMKADANNRPCSIRACWT
jgi:hypothetical protein